MYKEVYYKNIDCIRFFAVLLIVRSQHLAFGSLHHHKDSLTTLLENIFKKDISLDTLSWELFSRKTSILTHSWENISGEKY